MPRIGWAISSPSRPAVATWYSNGWNVWKLLASISSDVERLVEQFTGDGQPAEPTTDDHDLRDGSVDAHTPTVG